MKMDQLRPKGKGTLLHPLVSFFVAPAERKREGKSSKSEVAEGGREIGWTGEKGGLGPMDSGRNKVLHSRDSHLSLSDPTLALRVRPANTTTTTVLVLQGCVLEPPVIPLRRYRTRASLRRSQAFQNGWDICAEMADVGSHTLAEKKGNGRFKKCSMFLPRCSPWSRRRRRTRRPCPRRNTRSRNPRSRRTSSPA